MNTANTYSGQNYSWLTVFSSLLFTVLLPFSGHGANAPTVSDEQFFTLHSGTNLRSFGGPEVRQLLFRKHGGGVVFGAKQQKLYCALKRNK